MSYLYETHLHTVQGSACASAPGQDYIKYYQDAGYTGIFVTDHFYGGNCVVNRNLPWKEWVKEYCRGFEAARDEGARRGLDVFFGWEETFEGDDYLVYGLDKGWLLKHPEARTWSRAEQYHLVKEAGGCVVHAHPFRQHHYIRQVWLAPDLIDGVEVANAGNHEQYYDALAMRYAVKLGLPVTAGTDIHHIDQAATGDLYGIYLDKKLESAGDYVTAIKAGAVNNLKTEAGRCESWGDEAVNLPVRILDKNERCVSRDIWAFLKPLGFLQES
jgi:hypothetical protein